MKTIQQTLKLFTVALLAVVSFLPAGLAQNFPSVTDYGAVGDGSTDDHAAFVDAIEASGNSPYPARGIVIVPPGEYYIGSTLDLDYSVHLIGGGTGLRGGNWATTLTFPSNTVGIIVRKGNATDGGDSTIIEGINLVGGGGGSSSAHGIDMEGRMKIRDCTISGFAGNGINNEADVNSGENSNANGWIVDTVVVKDNGGHGVYMNNGDSNAGVGRSIQAFDNGGWGIYDSSFLGNTYVGCYASGNSSGPYKAEGAGSTTAFVGCSSASNQSASDIDKPIMVVGGDHQAGITGNGYFLVNGSNPVAKGETSTNATVRIAPADNGTDDSLIMLKDSVYTSWPYRLKYNTGAWLLDWANIGTGDQLKLYTRAATTGAGYQRDMSGKNGGLGLPRGYYGSDMRLRGDRAAAPTSGNYLRGDIYYNQNPSPGSPVGWVCVTGGSPGTWKGFGDLAP